MSGHVKPMDAHVISHVQTESGDAWTVNNRTIRFRLADSSFIDMESIRLGMTIQNTTIVTGAAAARLTPNCSPNGDVSKMSLVRGRSSGGRYRQLRYFDSHARAA